MYERVILNETVCRDENGSVKKGVALIGAKNHCKTALLRGKNAFHFENLPL